VAGETGHSASQVAIAWVRQRQRGATVPIIGVTKISQLRDNIGSLEVTLTQEQMQRLDEVSRIELGFPLDFLGGVREIVYGKTFPLIDDHRRRG
jgi:diketogulonate reductase-like aldo/keto reductase